MLPALRLITLALSSAALSACSLNGTYQDSSRDDAAKLRYIANTSNATLDIYQGSQCTGSTTGILNNLFVADTRRRADMSVAPGAKARGLLEIRLTPDQPLYVFANTLGTGTVCSAGFTLTPAAGSEYEVSFNEGAGYCQIQLSRLQRIDGQDVRIPYPIIEQVPENCRGTSPLFPVRPVAQATTVQRSTLIEGIIDDSLTAPTRMIAQLRDRTLRQDPADKQTAERRKVLGASALPEAYWSQYQANLQAFAQALTQVRANSEERFREENREYLNSVSDQQLQVWAGLAESDNRYNTRELRLKYMSQYYGRVYQRVAAQAQLEHLRAMARLDRQYGVCERYAGCWKL
ncbi:hypothetical protein ACTWM0_11660 [Pseudomonas machongensis]